MIELSQGPRVPEVESRGEGIGALGHRPTGVHMPLRDPHAGEMTVEINRDTFKLYQEALAAVKLWTDELNRLKTTLMEEIGDAYAGTVDGQKVVSHRPKDQYAVTRLRNDFPDLTEHFMKWKTEQVFDVEAFSKQHPEILEQYRVRALVQLG